MAECYGSWLLSQALDEIDKEECEQEQIDPEEWDDLMKTKVGSTGEKTYDRHRPRQRI